MLLWLNRPGGHLSIQIIDPLFNVAAITIRDVLDFLDTYIGIDAAGSPAGLFRFLDPVFDAFSCESSAELYNQEGISVQGAGGERTRGFQAETIVPRG